MPFVGSVGSLLAVASVAAGCMSTQTVHRPASLEAITAINAAAGQDPPLVIDYRLGPPPVEPLPRQARSLQDADAKKMTFINVAGAPQSVDSALVKRVHVTNRGTGAMHGLGIGALAGALFGFIAVVAEPPQDDLVFSKREAMAVVSIVTGVMGAVIGTVIGGLVGHQTAFEFEDRP